MISITVGDLTAMMIAVTFAAYASGVLIGWWLRGSERSRRWVEK